MHIIIDVPRLPENFLPGATSFFLNLMLGIARKEPADTFIIVTDVRPVLITDLPANVTHRLIKTGLFKWLGYKWWYYFGLPWLLKQQKADLLITIDNVHIKRYKIPCCHFPVNLLSPDILNPRSFLGKWSPVHSIHKQIAGVLQRAAILITFTEHDRQIIQKRYNIAPEKCKCLHLSRTNKPLPWPEIQSIKTRYSGGLEYFIFAGDIHQRHLLVELLKAYSEFKKWQRSNMQLIITGSVTGWTQQFLEKLAGFKYRNDVHVVPNPPDDILRALIGGAYAFIYPARSDHFPENILLSMQADVPVIASPLAVIKELANNAVIYPETDDASGFAKTMQEVYKDERLRTDIIAAARNHMEQGKKYNMVTDCRNLLWQSLHNNS